ncbi:MAG: hypothetical protein HY390_05460 [Deltaproteobacteria bacterium]|nr:hypothetical protein [Deltaproteobacteria bacterium]
MNNTTSPSHTPTPLKSIEGHMDFESLYTAGLGYETFLRKIKNEATLVASICSKTKKRFLPARLFNEQNMNRMTEIEPVTEPGTLTSFTSVHQDLDSAPLSTPITVGWITWKGIEGGLIHFIQSNGKKLKAGLKVKPHFRPAESRTGSILDIECFKVL